MDDADSAEEAEAEYEALQGGADAPADAAR